MTTRIRYSGLRPLIAAFERQEDCHEFDGNNVKPCLKTKTTQRPKEHKTSPLAAFYSLSLAESHPHGSLPLWGCAPRSPLGLCPAVRSRAAPLSPLWGAPAVPSGAAPRSPLWGAPAAQLLSDQRAFDEHWRTGVNLHPARRALHSLYFSSQC